MTALEPTIFEPSPNPTHPPFWSETDTWTTFEPRSFHRKINPVGSSMQTAKKRVAPSKVIVQLLGLLLVANKRRPPVFLQQKICKVGDCISREWKKRRKVSSLRLVETEERWLGKEGQIGDGFEARNRP